MGWLDRFFGGGDNKKTLSFEPDSVEMREASQRARETFRYFWREMTWEYQRIVPGCEIAHVKAAFSEDGVFTGAGVEHMWLKDVDFDGHVVTGELINSPHGLTSVRLGDSVELPMERVSDWMYSVGGHVCGAFTVNLIRSGMSASDLRKHDRAWGLDFGDPAAIDLVPTGGGWAGADDEHPMSLNAASAFTEQLQANPEVLNEKDALGRTLLHRHALGGSLPTVEMLLGQGADASATTLRGDTALSLARRLDWSRVVACLEQNGVQT